MLHVLEHSLLETARLLPFLYLTYLVMEFLEHRWGEKAGRLMGRAGRFGPLVGGLLGIVPQCGFSAAAAGLYAGRVISLGTLLAVFLSTSDEMLPILISYRTPAATVLGILGIKVVIAVAAGMAADLVFRRRPPREEAIGDLCGHDHCHCEGGNLFLAALRHTASIAVFLLLFTVAIHLALHLAGEDLLARFLGSSPMLGVLLAALVGLVPNCAGSVAITTLYLDGILSFGAMMAGLLVSTGIGLLMLARVDRNRREALGIAALLLAVGIVCGGALDLLGVAL